MFLLTNTLRNLLKNIKFLIESSQRSHGQKKIFQIIG